MEQNLVSKMTNCMKQKIKRTYTQEKQRLISFHDDSDANSLAKELQNDGESTKLTSRYVC